MNRGDADAGIRSHTDARLRYVATTRLGFDGPVGRAIGIATSTSYVYSFSPHTEPINTLSGDEDAQLYSQITFPWLDIYLGIVMVYDATSDAQKVHCRLAFAQSVHAFDWRWVEGTYATAPDFVPLGADGDFDSHICFAAATPVSTDDGERVYYMGGDGPHSGDRNSSFALATLRKDGFAGIVGSGRFALRPVVCGGATLTVTADIAPGGSIRVGLLNSTTLGLDAATAVTADATDAAVAFAGGADFTDLVGGDVSLEVELVNATIYVVGFDA